MKIVGKTDIGLLRETNQDVFKIVALNENSGFALVCDGMGGVNGGDRASSIAKMEISKHIVSAFKKEVPESMIRGIMLTAIDKANKKIYEISKENPELLGMGTTVVLVLIINEKAYVAYVGDSRLYLYRKSSMIQVTKDHSRVQELIDKGIITKEQARTHPEKNMITRALGIGKDVNVDFFNLMLQKEDKLLLCSDGLSNICTDEEIAFVLGQKQAESAVKTLIDLANMGGGNDNITVVIAEN